MLSACMLCMAYGNDMDTKPVATYAVDKSTIVGRRKHMHARQFHLPSLLGAARSALPAGCSAAVARTTGQQGSCHVHICACCMHNNQALLYLFDAIQSEVEK